MSTEKRLLYWQQEFNCKLYQPLKESSLRKSIFLSDLLKRDLYELYAYSNGLSLNWFKVLPLEDSENIKRSWDSLEKQINLKKWTILVEMKYH